MKHLLLSALLVVGLAGCSKKSADPTPASPLIATWTFKAASLWTTPKSGVSNPYSSTFIPVAGTARTITYYADGHYSTGSVNTSAQTNGGSYTYTDTSIVLNPGTTQQVVYYINALSDKQLVVSYVEEDASATRSITDTYTR